jgi:RHS repeat-associated protein
MRRLSVFLFPFTFFLALSLPLKAQVPDPTVATRAPIPGVGHNYIGIGSETVNPADGSFTFNLPLNPPPGRELSFPFGMRYGSYEQFSVGSNGVSPLASWWPVNVAPFQFYGWSYLLPSYSARVYTQASYPNPNNMSETIYCDGAQNYVFRIDGVQYLPDIQNIWPDPSSSPAPSCNQVTLASEFEGFSFSPSPASFTPTATQPSMVVVDQSGTTYTFPSYYLNYSGSSGLPESWGLLAQTITDKNGNQISYSGTQNYQFGSGAGGTQLPTPAGSYKDTLGRTAVSWSGLGSSSGDQVTLVGLAKNIVVNWSSSLNVSFPEKGYMASGTSTCSLGNTAAQQIQGVSEIALPNGQTYSFAYDPTYGTVNKITFPDGGYVRYVWGIFSSSGLAYIQWSPEAGDQQHCYLVYDTPVITDRYVSFTGGSESTEVLHQHFAYTPISWITNSSGVTYWNTKKTTVTTTDNVTGLVSVAVYNYMPEYAGYSGGVPSSGSPVETSILYQNSSGTTLKTVNKSWYDAFTQVGEQTILDNGQGMATLRCWDSAYHRVLNLYEYGFQAEGAKPADPSCAILPDGGTTLSGGLTTSAIGPLRRQTANVYHNFIGGSPSTHIIDEPNTVTVSDGSNNQLKLTTFAYDASSLQSSGAATGLVAAPGLRGNPTSVARWINTGGSATSTYTYYNTGQLYQATDACGNATCADMSSTTGVNHTTTYTYSDSYSSCSGSAPPSGQTNAYLTQVTYPNTTVAHVEDFCWNYSTGLLGSHTDQNNQTTSYLYVDPLNRLTEIENPPDPNNGNQRGTTTYAYNDSTPSPTYTTSVLMNTSNQYINTTTTMDGMGHVIETLRNGYPTSDPDCPSGDRVDTIYDGLGRVYTVSNPYCSTGDLTYGLTTYTYDALDRTCVVAPPTGTAQSSCPTGAVTGDIVTTYSGRATAVFDEGNGTQSVERISQVDGLGHLVSICEVSSATLTGQNATPAACNLDITPTPNLGFLTTYLYNALDDLTNVTQGTMAARTFSYDSLSRLLCASNPENSSAACPTTATSSHTAGTVGYSYDANSNLSTRTDARNIVTTYTYDSLNRNTQKSYSDGTPTATFLYDASSAQYGISISNPIGRLVQATATCAFTINEYDPVGRVSEQFQQIPTNCTDPYVYEFMPYTYDLMGNMTSSVNGEFITFTYAYNSVARLQSLTSSLSDQQQPPNLMTSAHYNALGEITSDTLGDGESESWIYNDKRGRLTSYTATLNSTTIYSLTIPTNGYAPNSDVLAANDSANGNWTYSYDPFNRLIGANETSPAQALSFTYDRFGNRWQQKPSGLSLSFTGNDPSSPKNNNRIDGYTYDAAGNLLSDGVNTYTYDAENRITTYSNTAGATASYVYDAFGQRVEKTSTSPNECDPSGGTVFYLHDLAGNTEVYTAAGVNQCTDDIFAGGRHLASYSGDTAFIHSDWLGTERARRFYYNQVTQNCTSNPFGDALACANAGSLIYPSPRHFTGKQHDIESSLDYFGARYYNSAEGRFTSADPKPGILKLLQNPQDLDLYSYVVNNPLSNIDPDGKDWKQAIADLFNGLHVSFSAGFGAAKEGKVLGSGAKASAQIKKTVDVNVQQGIKITTSVEAGVTGAVLGQEAGPQVSKPLSTTAMDSQGHVTTEAGGPTEASLAKLSTGTSSSTTGQESKLTIAGFEDNLVVPVETPIGVIPVPTPVTYGVSLAVDSDALFKAVVDLFLPAKQSQSSTQSTQQTQSNSGSSQ